MFVLISLTGVYAADNQTDVVLDDDSSTEDLKVVEEDSATGEISDLWNSFSELDYIIDGAAAGTEVKLDQDFVYQTFYGDEEFEEGIKLRADNIILNGDGHRIDASHKARIFNVEGRSITIKNCIFINANFTGNGGAVYAKEGTIENCTFINCTGQNGGAVYLYNGTISNSRFIDNSGTSGAGAYMRIGNLVNSLFINNSATNDGGAGMLGWVNVQNCSFINNHAVGSGGSIEFNYGVSISNSRFINNTAQEGGAISTSYYLTVTNSEFINNKAINGNGGSISMWIGEFENCNFTNNYANNGGAIYTWDNIAINNGYFYNNTAQNSAGAIYFYQQTSSINNTKFHKNNARTGGAICTFSSLNIYNSAFNDNYAVIVRNVAVLGSGKLITNNVTPKNLACGSLLTLETEINQSQNNIFKLTKDYIFDDYYDSDRVWGVTIGKDNFTIDGQGFTIDGANSIGLLKVMGNVTIRNVNFVNANVSDSYGGAIYLLRNGNVENCNFTKNFAQLGGGAIASEGDLIITESVFKDNSADDLRKNIVLLKTATVTLINVTPQDIGPFRLANIEVMNVINAFYEGTVKILVNVTNPDVIVNKGIVSITLNNKKYIANVENGLATIELPTSQYPYLNAKDYEGVVYFESNEYYAEPSAKISFTVYKKQIDVELISITGTTYEDTVVIKINVSSNGEKQKTGRVLARINNVDYRAEINDGISTMSLIFLDAGNYSGVIKFDEGDNYISNNQTISFDVSKFPITLNVINITDHRYGETLHINVNVTSNGETFNKGNVYIIINGTNYTAEVKNGLATIEIENINAGYYSGNVTYDNGKNYENPTQLVNFEVYRLTSQINVVDVINATYQDSVKIFVEVTAKNQIINEGNVSITVNGTEFTSKVVNGAATIEISGVTIGEYERYFVRFDGGENYEISTDVVSFKVARENATITIGYIQNCTYGGNVTVIVIVIGSITTVHEGTVYLETKDKNYSLELKSGFVRFDLPNLATGVYDANITFDGGVDYNTGRESIKFEVKPAQVNLTVDVKDIMYGETVKINIDVTAYGKALNEGNVSVCIDSKDYMANVVNGTATIEISNLSTGSYEANVLFDAGENYTTSAKLIKFSVLKQNTVIEASTRTYVINYDGEYSMVFKDKNGNVITGKKITFTLNGKNIGSATTDSHGFASIKLTAKILKTEKSGKKNLVIKFEGDNNYNAIDKTIKITINKEKTKITAKKKTFKKSKKVKKYAITLKNSEGKAVKKVRVTLKIKGKIFKAKTNNKGKAIFKIKKFTKKGNFKAKITFKGNNYYLKVNKKVKIKIK